MKQNTVLLVAAVLGLALVLILVLRGDGGPRASDPGRPAVASAEAGEVAKSPLEDAEVLPVASAERTAFAPRTPPEVERDAKRASLPEPTGPWIRGWVVDSKGTPVGDVAVHVTEASDRPGLAFALAKAAFSESATTSANGSFRIPRGPLGASEIELDLRGRGFEALSERRALERESGDEELLTFVLHRGVVLGGTVVDSEGVAVLGATVRRTERDVEQALGGMLAFAARMGADGVSATKTDAEGRFLLANEPAGEWTLAVEHPSQPDDRFDVDARVPGTERIDLVLRLRPAARIEGRIAGFPEGKEHVVAQAEALAGKESSAMAAIFDEIGFGAAPGATVRPDGTFAIEGLVRGERYRVRAVQKEGMLGATPCTDSKSVAAGEGEVELEWDAGASLVFRVVDAATSAHVDEPSVRYRWLPGERDLDLPQLPKTRSFAGHEVRLEELRPRPAPGQLELVVKAPGYLDHRETGISVPEGARVDLGSVRLRRAPKLLVKVVDAASGEPVKRARVSLESDEGDAESAYAERIAAHVQDPFALPPGVRGRTEDDGTCELECFSTRAARLSVSRSGYADYQRSGVTLPTDRDIELTVELVAGGHLDLRVVDTNGAPVSGATVRHRRPSGELTERRASSSGEIACKDLAPGEHGFHAERSRGPAGTSVTVSVGTGGSNEGAPPPERDWTRVLVGSGSEGELTLRVPVESTLAGVVTAGGEPVSGARVLLFAGEQGDEGELAAELFSESMMPFLPGAPLFARTDSHGHFRLAEVPIGKHRLSVRRGEGLPPHVVPVEVREGQNRCEVAVPSATLEGRVLDEAGRPIAGAAVSVAKDDADSHARRETLALFRSGALFGTSVQDELRTDGDGRFTVRGVPIGEALVIEARAEGYAEGTSAPLTAEADQTQRGIEVRLARAGSIRVRAPGNERMRVVSATYEGDVEPAPTRRHAFLSGGEEAVLSGLLPGAWRLRGGDSDEGSLVQVSADAETLFTLAP